MPETDFKHIEKFIQQNGKKYRFIDLSSLEDPRYDRLPYSIRVLLESVIRNCDGFRIKHADVENILDWSKKQHDHVEILFQPARVLLQDYTGIAVLVDLAAMRSAVQEMKGDWRKVQPQCPVEMVIDHSVQILHAQQKDAAEFNHESEFSLNKERFQFFKWSTQSFKNVTVLPPASGILHQINMEYLARLIFCDDNFIYPDTVVGTDSHTPLIGGLGIQGWGVGGIEAASVMLGQPISMVLPQVVGVRLTGEVPQTVTAQDLALLITEKLREVGVVGKFVEFFGPGVCSLTIGDRATISCMSPEQGSTTTFFPCDSDVMDYLKYTGRDVAKLELAEQYLKRIKLMRNYKNSTEDPIYTQVLELDLSKTVRYLAGPKRPHDLIPLEKVSSDFDNGLTQKVSFKGYGLEASKLSQSVAFEFQGKSYTVGHGSIVLAAITSCTSTCNPSMMLAAGMLAKKAVEAGLMMKPYIKTTISPGSRAVLKYLQQANLLTYLEQLGFFIVGFGCMTCIGNSGPLPQPVTNAIVNNDLISVGILSGDRNFEGRIHPLTRANYLASPPLVVAYALAGKIDINFDIEPIGKNKSGESVFLSDIFPNRSDVIALEEEILKSGLIAETYQQQLFKGSAEWQNLTVSQGNTFEWDPTSTYMKCPPFFKNMTEELPKQRKIENAFCLLKLGDSVTTDHISPGGTIAQHSPAGRYLTAKGVSVKNLNTYGSRRGNDEVMTRGAFAGSKLRNGLLGDGRVGPKTIHLPSGEELDVFDAAVRYREEGHSIVVVAGKEYGCGSSRDWAAKGPYLQGVRAVIAESFERIHRSNLVGVGVLPLQFLPGQSAETFGLTGRERFTVQLSEQNLSPCQKVTVKTDSKGSFEVICRFDTEIELQYYRNGGILQYVLRQLVRQAI